jgi:integrase
MYTFTEPDEGLAIAHFHEWKEGHESRTISIHAASARSGDREAFRAAKNIEGTAVRDADGIHFFSDAVQSATFWPWLRKLILDTPVYVAQMTGIEQIGYLAELPKPAPSPTLEEVGTLYLAKPKLSSNWRAKCKQFWREFSECVEVQKLRELTQELLVEYHDMVLDAGETATYTRQRFGSIKTIINFPTKRGRWAEDCRRALALCGVLTPPAKSSADPRPIGADEFKAIYRAADAKMKAAMLLALNCCMYAGEVAALKWSEVDLVKGTVVTARNKTGVVRVGVLWPGTLQLLKKLQRGSDYIFTTETGTPADYLCMYRQWKLARAAAILPTVQFSQIRDGSYTSAVEGRADLNTVKLLAGHSTGISDAYLKRRPTMVAAACDAIRRAYKVEKL